MRKIKITPGEHYHIYNRGNNKQNIFFDERDRARFLFLMLYFQSDLTLAFNNLSRQISYFVEHRVFNISKDATHKIIETRCVELIGFTLMPNHFHLILKEREENGISCYMQRILNAYTKYFNAKCGKSGHLFQGPFQVIHIEDNEQLLHLSAYIHRNPRELKQWENKEDLFPWSSYQDYARENRWNDLLKHQVITGQFSDGEEYKNFIDTSGTKLLFDEKHLQ